MAKADSRKVLANLKAHHRKGAPTDMRRAFERDPSRFAEFSAKTDEMLLDYSKCAVNSRTMKLLAALGMAEAAAKLPEQLSGGMRQRAAIARALANDPALILADEPTGNLDTRNAAAVFDIFARLAAEEGRAILVVTHDAELAKRANRRIHLVDGRIVSDSRAG